LYLLARVLWVIGNGIYKHRFLKELNLHARYGGKGTWAVITGGSEGIGRGFAYSLAKR